MEGAGKLVEDDELREAMQEKGLGTPATRAAIIEGLLNEKYMIREGRELIPTAKAFQLMTLLRGLGVEELSKPELTGEWEFKLAQMEHGKLGRQEFMHEIAEMTRHIVKKAKEYDHETVPGDYATLETPCPNCGGIVKENYRRYTCTGPAGAGPRLRILVREDARRPDVRAGRGRAVPARQANRSAGRVPFEGRLAVHGGDRSQVQRGRKELEARIRLSRTTADDTGELVDFSGLEPLGACRKCGGRVFELSSNYVCENAVRTDAQPEPTCDFKSRKIILQQPVTREQMVKLLETGKTDLLDKFISMRTRRPFKAFLAWDPEAGKIKFEFTPSKFPRKGPAKPFVRREAAAAAKPAKKMSARAGTKKAKVKSDGPKAPRASTGKPLTPSHELAAVIGNEPVARTQVIKKLWDYIKANGLQDTTNKRAINADALLLPDLRQAAGHHVRARRHRRQACELIAMTLNHLNLTVTDPVETSQFLAKYFGLRAQGGNGGMQMLYDDSGMVLTLIKGRAEDRVPNDGAADRQPNVKYPSSFHIGFIQDSRQRVDEINQQLRDDGVKVEAPSHQHGSWTFYFTAPGGFTVEVMG